MICFKFKNKKSSKRKFKFKTLSKRYYLTFKNFKNNNRDDDDENQDGSNNNQ